MADDLGSGVDELLASLAHKQTLHRERAAARLGSVAPRAAGGALGLGPHLSPQSRRASSQRARQEAWEGRRGGFLGARKLLSERAPADAFVAGAVAAACARLRGPGGARPPRGGRGIPRAGDAARRGAPRRRARAPPRQHRRQLRAARPIGGGAQEGGRRRGGGGGVRLGGWVQHGGGDRAAGGRARERCGGGGRPRRPRQLGGRRRLEVPGDGAEGVGARGRGVQGRARRVATQGDRAGAALGVAHEPLRPRGRPPRRRHAVPPPAGGGARRVRLAARGAVARRPLRQLESGALRRLDGDARVLREAVAAQRGVRGGAPPSDVPQPLLRRRRGPPVLATDVA